MRFLYFGTITNTKLYNAILPGFRVKPSVAPLVFESALLEGFRENDAQLEVASFPVIPAFPKSNHLAWGPRKVTLDSGYASTWIPAINITGFKQLSQRFSSWLLLKHWEKRHRGEEKAVILYSAYQPIAKSIVTFCKKHGIKCYAIIPDLPKDMYNLGKIHPVKKMLSRLYVRAAEKVQGCFDGYIYLTEAMKDVINPEAPYIVMEGIADISQALPPEMEEKAPGFNIMYAGTLHEKYGIGNLVQAFLNFPHPEAQLWIFGSGDYQDKIQELSVQDNRIRYFGRVDRNQVLEYERKASLLVNVRSDQDEFTKYSFPSKVIEYMLSGTPLLMTQLPGIPKEYYCHTFSMPDNRVDTICSALKVFSQVPPEERLAFGLKAQKFIATEKCAGNQGKRVLDFVCQHR